MRIFFAFAIFLAFLPPALAGRRVFIYPTNGSVSYTSTPGSGNCRMGLSQTEPAEILEEKDGYLRVQFTRQGMSGCFGDQFLNGRDINSGWVPKNEISYGEDDQTPVKIAPVKNSPCPEARPLKEPDGIRDLMEKLNDKAAGMKSPSDIDKYLDCYPNSKDGKANYQKYSPFIDKIAASFSFEKNGSSYSVNPSLMRCLLRRESAFDPQNKSHTGAVGLGQHTDVNIRHINNRLKQPNSWERQLWERFFKNVKNDPQAKAMLAECPSTSNGQMPKFESKADAACPLQSMAASAIYNLQIQEGLRRSSRVKDVPPAQQLDYQVSIAATYNLGDGVASKAVSDLYVGGWLNAIKSRAPTQDKSNEVNNHITAVRNCMQQGNWDPMHPKDKPRCENFPGNTKAKADAANPPGRK